MDKEIEKLKQQLDSKINNLEIFKLSTEDAIVFLLKVFEDKCRFNSFKGGRSEETEFIAREGVDGLNVLLPKVLDKCKSSGKIDLRNHDEKYQTTFDAIEFATHYYSIYTSGINLCDEDVYQLNIQGNDVKFKQTVEDFLFDTNSQIISIHNKRKEVDRIKKDVIDEEVEKRARIINNLISKIKKTSDTEFEYEISSATVEYFKGVIKNVYKHKWQFDTSINLGPYTINDASKIWDSLVLISIIHHFACYYSGTTGVGLDCLPLVYEKNILIKKIKKYSKLSNKVVKNVLNDLIYTTKYKEIFFQPLILIPRTRMVLITPHLFISSSQERNFMKLWAKKYVSIYDSQISKVKEGIEKNISKIFRDINTNKELLVVSSKKIKEEGRDITDIDVAVINKKTNELMLIEVKWFLYPDSPFEVKGADRKLNKGISQLKLIEEYLSKDSNNINIIFDDKNLKINKIYKIVLSMNTTGSYWIEDKKNKIFNYDTFIKILNKTDRMNIKKFYKKLAKTHKFRPFVDFLPALNIYEFSSYKLFLPGVIILNECWYMKNFLRFCKYLLINKFYFGCSVFWKKQKNIVKK